MHILYNRFHHRRATVRTLTLSCATVARVRRALCPHPDCRCAQDALAQYGERPYAAIDHANGTVTLVPRNNPQA